MQTGFGTLKILPAIGGGSRQWKIHTTPSSQPSTHNYWKIRTKKRKKYFKISCWEEKKNNNFNSVPWSINVKSAEERLQEKSPLIPSVICHQRIHHNKSPRASCKNVAHTSIGRWIEYNINVAVVAVSFHWTHSETRAVSTGSEWTTRGLQLQNGHTMFDWGPVKHTRFVVWKCLWWINSTFSCNCPTLSAGRSILSQLVLPAAVGCGCTESTTSSSGLLSTPRLLLHPFCHATVLMPTPQMWTTKDIDTFGCCHHPITK